MEITVAIDCMGGDHGPHVTVPAALNFLKSHSDVDVRMGFQEIERRRHGNVRTMIAAHAINGYGDFHEARCEASPASLNGGGRSRLCPVTAPAEALLALGPDDLLAAIVTARADVMT